MIEIPLTQGQTAVIDDIDSDLAKLKWQAHYSKTAKRFYARRCSHVGLKVLRKYMHRVILSRILGRELARSEIVDHKDLDTLNNRRENLRLANSAKNASNRPKPSNNTSGYKGVTWSKKNKKWVAQIEVDDQHIYLGTFVNIEDAAEAYRVAAIKYHEEFARWTEKSDE